MIFVAISMHMSADGPREGRSSPGAIGRSSVERFGIELLFSIEEPDGTGDLVDGMCGRRVALTPALDEEQVIVVRRARPTR